MNRRASQADSASTRRRVGSRCCTSTTMGPSRQGPPRGRPRVDQISAPWPTPHRIQGLSFGPADPTEAYFNRCRGWKGGCPCIRVRGRPLKLPCLSPFPPSLRQASSCTCNVRDVASLQSPSGHGTVARCVLEKEKKDAGVRHRSHMHWFGFGSIRFDSTGIVADRLNFGGSSGGRAGGAGRGDYYYYYCDRLGLGLPARAWIHVGPQTDCSWPWCLVAR